MKFPEKKNHFFLFILVCMLSVCVCASIRVDAGWCFSCSAYSFSTCTRTIYIYCLLRITFFSVFLLFRLLFLLIVVIIVLMSCQLCFFIALAHSLPSHFVRTIFFPLKMFIADVVVTVYFSVKAHFLLFISPSRLHIRTFTRNIWKLVWIFEHINFVVFSSLIIYTVHHLLNGW